MKGTDAPGLQFIVFKCTVTTDPPRRLFTTFFQRYTADLTFHTAGHHDGAGRVWRRWSVWLRTGRMDLRVSDMAQLCVGCSGYRDHGQIAGLDPRTIDTVTLGWS